MRKFYWIIFCFSLFILISVSIIFIVLGINIVKSEKISKEKNITNEITITTSSIEEKLSPNAIFGLKKFYDECGHYEYEEVELPIELVNLTKQQIEDFYDNWEIEEFSENKLVLVKEINGYCNNHFLVKLDDNYINIYKLTTIGNLKLYKSTTISREFLPENDISTLEEGIMIYGMDKIIEVLEDYE